MHTANVRDRLSDVDDFLALLGALLPDACKTQPVAAYSRHIRSYSGCFSIEGYQPGLIHLMLCRNTAYFGV